jgi:Protein of unknown function (DUF2844)
MASRAATSWSGLLARVALAEGRRDAGYDCVEVQPPRSVPPKRIIFLFCVVLVSLVVPRRTDASLGGSEASVSADRVQLQAALLRIQRGDGFTVHEIQTAPGTVVREFVSSSGTVFGVAWQGPWIPDMQQLLGSYFSEYQAALARRSDRHRRGPVAIDTGSLVVQISGHPRAFSGRAYVVPLVPAGVQTDAIR